MNRDNVFPRPEAGTVGQIRQIEPYQLGVRRPFPVVVDVREEEQFVLGHIDGAKRISNLSTLMVARCGNRRLPACRRW
ncbi:MAG TPA: hypothetical protein VFO40_06350 [Chthoniobacterales bacterium]|nr:hypothetical protein [Chthoniobacterales bacterium]